MGARCIAFLCALVPLNRVPQPISAAYESSYQPVDRDIKKQKAKVKL
jgi:hypothetical protein